MTLCFYQCWLKYLFSFFLADTSLKFTPGPYGLIFASFIPFYLDIPVSTKIRVFGVQFSDKSFIYLAGLQVKFGLCCNFLIPFYLALYASFFCCKHLKCLCLSASAIILEKIYLPRDLWLCSWFLVSLELLLHQKGEGCTLSLLAKIYLL